MGNPTWMYRRGDDSKVESKLFKDSDDIPKGGWYESPAFVPETEPAPRQFMDIPTPEPQSPKPRPRWTKGTTKPRTTRRKSR